MFFEKHLLHLIKQPLCFNYSETILVALPESSKSGWARFLYYYKLKHVAYLIQSTMTHTVKEEAQDCEDVLWAKFKGGDIIAYSKIYHTYYSLLYNYGYNTFTDKEFVKDTLQDLFLELWQTRERLGKVESVKFYLLVCFRRKIFYNISVKKKEASRVTERMFVVNSYESELIHEEVLEAQTMQLTKELYKLPARQKEAIYLKFYQELSYLQITEVMCLKYQTVRDLIYKGLKQLRQKLSF